MVIRSLRPSNIRTWRPIGKIPRSTLKNRIFGAVRRGCVREDGGRNGRAGDLGQGNWAENRLGDLEPMGTPLRAESYTLAELVEDQAWRKRTSRQLEHLFQ